ncbi:hypothetical protein ON010_g1341 [Phytophthora cinnamomi]|nr:hypothetical protein ON010_g1341 [Phytophthora cinnamomi]
MYSSGGSASGGAEDGCGKDTASTDDPGKSGKNEKQAGRVVEATSQPHLDLSLVFTKLADLRRSTDASLNSLQQSIKGVSGTTQSQQEQLDALRNNVVFNEHLQAHLVEARLAMQKELLARNQTFQDRTKPQLVEWRKALELTEDKLLQGNSDDETLHALQQMQRCYHRTVLSIAPLVNSPLSIAETLQTLSDEVKQLQNAVRLGVVPLRVTDYSNVNENSEGEPNKEDREEEYTRKLRYLDEEIDATLQVNITTEKKNDPLIKGLDAMREKPSDVVAVSSGSSTNSSSADNHAAHDERRHSFQRNPESLREMELRLSGAVRRLAMVEEDIERLNSLTAHLNAADRGPGNAGSDGSMPIVSRRAPSTNNLRTELVMEEIEKLRKEVYAEIAKLSTQSLGDANGGSNSNSNSTTSLVSMDRRSMVEAAAKQGDVLTDLYSQMTGRELDTRLYNSAEGQKQFYDNFIKEVTKKVSGIINADKGGPRGPGIGGAANANVNYRLLLDNFAQKVDDRLEDAREFTTEELARLRRELMEQLKIRFEVALRDIRGELMLLQPTDGDSTAMGTKPVMCVACSRPVPVSTVIREAGSLPADIVNPEPVNPALPAEFQDYDRPDDEFVFRAGFKMPANDRKILTLPFLTTAMRNKMVLNKPEGKRKRPPRQSHLNRVDNVVREIAAKRPRSDVKLEFVDADCVFAVCLPLGTGYGTRSRFSRTRLRRTVVNTDEHQSQYTCMPEMSSLLLLLLWTLQHVHVRIDVVTSLQNASKPAPSSAERDSLKSRRQGEHPQLTRTISRHQEQASSSRSASSRVQRNWVKQAKELSEFPISTPVSIDTLSVSYERCGKAAWGPAAREARVDTRKTPVIAARTTKRRASTLSASVLYVARPSPHSASSGSSVKAPPPPND